MVDLNLPTDDEPGVRDPPLSALGGVGVGRERERKVRLREPSEILETRRVRQRQRERVAPAPAPPVAPPILGGRERRGGYAPPMGGYGYVMPGY